MTKATIQFCLSDEFEFKNQFCNQKLQILASSRINYVGKINSNMSRSILYL